MAKKAWEQGKRAGWVHKHPFFNFQYFQKKNNRNFFSPNSKSYVDIYEKGKRQTSYNIEPHPSNADYDHTYPTQNGAWNVIIAYNHIMFFYSTGVKGTGGAGNFIFIDRKGFDQ